MGLIASRMTEIRFNAADWMRDTLDDTDGQMSPSGIRINGRVALGLSTIWRCVDLLSSTVALAPKDVFVKVGGKSFPEYANLPSWLSTPNPSDPTYTSADYFSEVVISLLLDGNYFVHVFPNVLDPQVLTVLDPTKVAVRKGPLFDMLDPAGRVIATLSPFEMLHGRWLRTPGMLRGISPLEALRRGIGSAIGAEEFGARFFGQGAALSFGVEVPTQLTEDQKNQLRDTLKRKHQSLNNSHAIGVLTGGAKFVTGLAPTPEQAQMLETRNYSVRDLARIYGVPPSMLGESDRGASSFASAEVHNQEFKDFGVLPLTKRIENQHDRLLAVPAGINDPNASVQLRFNLDYLSRANLLERYQAHAAGVQGGLLMPNEARALEDLPAAPGGDRLYMQQQMVPITELGMDPNEPAETAGEPAADMMGATK